MTFKELSIGDRFRFASEGAHFGMMIGPWRKVSPRVYVWGYNPDRSKYRYRVGSIGAEVVKEQ